MKANRIRRNGWKPKTGFRVTLEIPNHILRSPLLIWLIKIMLAAMLGWLGDGDHGPGPT